MKTVTPAALFDAYQTLNPTEHLAPTSPGIRSEVERVMGNWLERYQRQPDRALSTVKTAWEGKVTAALFKALGIKQPRKKSDMIKALTVKPQSDRNLTEPCGVCEYECKHVSPTQVTENDMTEITRRTENPIALDKAQTQADFAANVIPAPPWKRNEIQFPRLLAEIMASGAINEGIWDALLDSMDLRTEELHELFERAQNEWQQIKSDPLTLTILTPPPTTLICPHCKYDGKEPTEHGEGFRYLANQTTWREVEGLKDGVLSIDGLYETYTDDQETDERLECRSCLNEFPIPPGVETDFH